METYDEFVERIKKERDFIELTPEILNELKSDDLMFLRYAEGGAMGEGGGVYILMRDKNLYHTNYLYGYVTMEMLKEKFEKIRDLRFSYLSLLFNSQTGFFESIALGAGNVLFVNIEIVDKFKNRAEVLKTDKCTVYTTLYKEWVNIANEIL